MEADEFVNIVVSRSDRDACPGRGHHGGKDHATQHFYDSWYDGASAKHSNPLLYGADALRHLYPKHTLVTTTPYTADILNLPGIQLKPAEKTPLITSVFYFPLARSLGSVPGVLVDQLQFGVFEATWQENEYIVFVVSYPAGFGNVTQYYILHEGPEAVARLLILAAGAWQNELHEEIWVFNQGFWLKDHALWTSIQKADWKDVILKDEFKKALQKDVYGFFDSKEIYEDLGIPWKRGLIMYGPPGNGKTISLKAIMKTCGEKGFNPLYVKSFQSWAGEEASMATVFDKARELSPSVVILEDLDSLINDRNRSFFLNQLDGLASNDGLLIIGTTNHFDRLDPGLSTRPSRFDRKFKFDDPDESERRLYATYWQKKLASNNEIDFPDSLVDEIAKTTDRFSFAYLKEAFVSALVIFAGLDGKKPPFSTVLFRQIEDLRKQLDKSLAAASRARMADQENSNIQKLRSFLSSAPPRRSTAPTGDTYRNVLDRLSGPALRDSVQNKIFVPTPAPNEQPYQPSGPGSSSNANPGAVGGSALNRAGPLNF